ncbi:MAG TPA: DUF1579 domain-containing protein [Pirellulaceae bacterium]
MTEATQAEPTFAMPTPQSEHLRLKPFVGKFRSEVKMWMGPGEPMVSTGTMVNTLELGGLYLQHDYMGDAHDGPFGQFEGKGFWGYNTTTQEYEGLWIDNACTTMQLDRGQVDARGKIWEMKSEVLCPQTRQPYKKRSVITLTDHDHHRLEMFMTGPDGAEMKTMEINYERVV